MDRVNGDIHVYSYKTVVLDEENEAREPIMLTVEDEDSEEEGAEPEPNSIVYFEKAE